MNQNLGSGLRVHLIFAYQLLPYGSKRTPSQVFYGLRTDDILFQRITFRKAQFGNTVFRTMAVEKIFEAIPTYKVDKAVPADSCLTEKQMMAGDG